MEFTPTYQRNIRHTLLLICSGGYFPGPTAMAADTEVALPYLPISIRYLLLAA
jgi:hypothetical protein